MTAELVGTHPNESSGQCAKCSSLAENLPSRKRYWPGSKRCETRRSRCGKVLLRAASGRARAVAPLNSFNSGKPPAGDGLAKPPPTGSEPVACAASRTECRAASPARRLCGSTIRTRSSTFSRNLRLRRKLGWMPIRRPRWQAGIRYCSQHEGDRIASGARMQVRSLRQARECEVSVKDRVCGPVQTPPRQARQLKAAVEKPVCGGLGKRSIVKCVGNRENKRQNSLDYPDSSLILAYGFEFPYRPLQAHALLKCHSPSNSSGLNGPAHSRSVPREMPLCRKVALPRPHSRNRNSFRHKADANIVDADHVGTGPTEFSELHAQANARAIARFTRLAKPGVEAVELEVDSLLDPVFEPEIDPSAGT